MLDIVLSGVIQLNVFEIIAKAGDGTHVSPAYIASQLPTQNQEATRVIDRMLRLLVAHSFLTCSSSHLANGGIERRYGLAPAAKFFVGDKNGLSLAPYHALTTGREININYNLKDAILEGGVTLFERITGKPCYEYMASSNPVLHNIFTNAMEAHSGVIIQKALKIYKGFEGLSSIVNVGGNNGSSLDMIISNYPSIRGINFDLPKVLQNAPSYNGIEHVGGDMFLEIPEGHAILLKFILHNWSDDQCIKLLKNCYKALPNKGKVIVMDPILPEVPQSDDYSKYASQLDIIMLTIYGGKERTKVEFEAMAVKAGFSELKVVCCAYDLWIMELIK